MTRKEETINDPEEWLMRDPEYAARVHKREHEIAERRAILDKNEKPLVEALTAVGWPEGVRQLEETRSVWDLVNTPILYTYLLPVLAEHLKRPYLPEVKEGIARALIVKEARGTGIARVVMDELKDQAKQMAKDYSEHSYRQVLIQALQYIGDASLEADVQQLLHGPPFHVPSEPPLTWMLEDLLKKLATPSRRKWAKQKQK